MPAVMWCVRKVRALVPGDADHRGWEYMRDGLHDVASRHRRGRTTGTVTTTVSLLGPGGCAGRQVGCLKWALPSGHSGTGTAGARAGLQRSWSWFHVEPSKVLFGVAGGESCSAASDEMRCGDRSMGRTLPRDGSRGRPRAIASHRRTCGASPAECSPDHPWCVERADIGSSGHLGPIAVAGRTATRFTWNGPALVGVGGQGGTPQSLQDHGPCQRDHHAEPATAAAAERAGAFDVRRQLPR